MNDEMNPQVHRELLDALTEVRRHYPTFRFAQLICALSSSARGHFAESTYDVEDEELLEAARSMIQRRTGVPLSSAA